MGAEDPDVNILPLMEYIASKIARHGSDVTFSWNVDSFQGIELGRVISQKLATVTFEASGRSHITLTEKGRAWAVLAKLRGYAPTV